MNDLQILTTIAPNISPIAPLSEGTGTDIEAIVKEKGRIHTRSNANHADEDGKHPTSP